MDKRHFMMRENGVRGRCWCCLITTYFTINYSVKFGLVSTEFDG